MYIERDSIVVMSVNLLAMNIQSLLVLTSIIEADLWRLGSTLAKFVLITVGVITVMYLVANHR